MSFQRDKGIDRRATAQQLTAPQQSRGTKNWLGHGVITQAAKIDTMLLTGARLEDMVNRLNTTQGRVRTHVQHLRNTHGLDVYVERGIYRFGPQTGQEESHPAPRPTPAAPTEPTRPSVASTPQSNRREKLVDYLKRRAIELDDLFAQEAEEAKVLLADPEWLWKAIIKSMATYGSSRGADRLNSPAKNYWQELVYARLASHSEHARRDTFHRIYREVNPRYLDRKVETLERAFVRIQRLGGPERAKEIALAQPDANRKIAFLKDFYGIGDKYARNIWMDVHDPDVSNHAAVDIRLRKIAQKINPNLTAFDAVERFYRSVAEETGLKMWSIDRIVYRDKDNLENILR